MIPFSNFISNGPRAGVVRGPELHQSLRGGMRGGLRGACGDMPAIGESMANGDPRVRDMPGGLKLVPTTWAQRAANGWYSILSIGTRIAVDGVAGSQTLNALKDIRLRVLASMHPIPDDPSVTAMPQIVDRDHVAISSSLYDAIRSTARVADPVGSTVPLCSWSAAAQLVSSASPSGTVAADITSTPSSWSSADSVEMYIVPAIAFLGAAALGVALVKWGAPKRGRR